MNLYKYNNIYFPDDDYFNSNPFPPEWMEIFEESEKLIEEELAREGQIISYTPKCSKREIKKMIDFEVGGGQQHLIRMRSQNKPWSAIPTQPSMQLKPANMTSFETFQLGENSKKLAPTTTTTLSRPFSAAELSGKKKIEFGGGKVCISHFLFYDLCRFAL